MSYEEWLFGGAAAFAFGLFVAFKLLWWDSGKEGEVEMAFNWGAVEAPEDPLEEWFEEPQEHLEAAAWEGEHQIPWWDLLAEQVEAEWAEEEWSRDPLRDEGFEDVRSYRVPRAARRAG